MISIHALVKRATNTGDVIYEYDDISIHALVKRATGSLSPFFEGGVDFNPRPREEGDRSCRLGGKRCDISIHALVKRATMYDAAKDALDKISIHALVKRATR